MQCVALNKRQEQCRNEARPGFLTCDVIGHQRFEPGAPEPGNIPPAEAPAVVLDAPEGFKLGPEMRQEEGEQRPPFTLSPSPQGWGSAAPPPPPSDAGGAGGFALPDAGDLFSSPLTIQPEPKRWEEPDEWGPSVLLSALEGGGDGPLGSWEPKDVEDALRDLYTPILESMGKKGMTPAECKSGGRYLTPYVNRVLGKLDPSNPGHMALAWLLVTHVPRFGADVLQLARRAGQKRRGAVTAPEAATAPEPWPGAPVTGF